MRILVCGSRDWTDQTPIYRELSQYPPGTVVIHGACRGADQLAGHVARMLSFEVLEFPADWSLGKKAGPMRNERMLREGKPDVVLAFHPNVEWSHGTADMLRRAVRKGVPNVVFAN